MARFEACELNDAQEDADVADSVGGALDNDARRVIADDDGKRDEDVEGCTAELCMLPVQFGVGVAEAATPASITE